MKRGLSVIQTQDYCSNCHKIWTLETGQGVCTWCGKLATAQTRPTHALRNFKSSGSRRGKQAPIKSNGYDHLEGEWLTYYKVASRFSHKAQAQDREDLLHTIIANIADAERNNGHKPFTQAVMYRIASVSVAYYWRVQYKLTNGLTCGNCSKEQRRKCKSNWSYSDCPKAVKLESLNKPVTDGDGNLTELGNLIVDDKAIDLADWLDIKTFLLGCPDRLIAIARKKQDGVALDWKDHKYLERFRQKEQKRLF